MRRRKQAAQGGGLQRGIPSQGAECQKAILQKYADDNGFTNAQCFVDDGYSGTTFDRPAWNRLSAMIDEGLIGTIIVKDEAVIIGLKTLRLKKC